MKSPTSLRTYLCLQFSIATALPVLIIALLIWRFLIPQMASTITAQQQSLARAVASHISVYLKGGEHQLVSLARFLEGEGGKTPSERTALLDAQCGAGHIFETIYMIAQGRNAITHVGLAKAQRARREDLLGIDLSGRHFIEKVDPLKRPVWSEIFLSTVSNRMAVALTVPLDEGGVIIGEITLAHLSEFLSRLPLQAGLFALVLDQHGRIAADSQGTRVGQALNLDLLPFRQTENGHIPANQAFQIESSPLVGTMVAVEHMGWTVLVAQPSRNAFKSIHEAFVLLVVGLFLSMIVSLIFAWYRAGKLSDLFRFYGQQAQAIARGAYDLVWPPSKTVEFQVLAQNLHTMAQTIRRRQEQLVANEQRLQDLMANVPGVVYQFVGTPEGKNVGIVTSMNAEKVHEIFGLDSEPDDFFETFVSCIPEEDQQRLKDSILNAIEKTTPWEYEGRFVKASGEQIWFSGRSAPHEAEGRVVYYGVLMDITARKKMERSLRLTQFCFEKVSVSIFRIADSGQILDANEEACRCLGYTREALCRLTVFDIAPDYSPQFHHDLMAKLRNMGGQTIETRHQRKNGEVFPVQIRIDAMRYENQEFIIAFVEDISERNRWKRDLEASERRYRALFNEAPMIYVLTENRDAGPYIRDVNNMFCDLLGYHREAVLGTSLLNYYTPASRDVVMTAPGVYQQARAGHPVTGERDLVARDGRIVNTLMHSTPEVEADGQAVGTRAMFLDISERKRALDALRQLRNDLANIINAMPSVLVGVDAEGRVTHWNRQAERATGRAAIDAIEKPLVSVFPRLKEEIPRVQAAIRGREVVRRTRIPRQVGGITRFEDLTIFSLSSDDAQGAVIRLDDVTERVRLEEMMIQSEKMLSVGGLAAGMAHEINNPLAGILQNTTVLKNRLSDDLRANVKAAEAAGTTMAAIRHYMALRKLDVMLENIHTSGERAATIVRNMLSFARKSERQFSSHHLGVLLDQTLDLIRTDYDMKKHYDFKQIQIIREYDAGVPLVVCDSSKMQQVFMNLLRNGAEAMAEVADRVLAPRFILRVKDDTEWVQVEIEDNGPGMDERVRRRIFEPFFTTKPVGKGTGLGLSVSYFIITEDHGGEMAVRPVDEGGACFVIRLPKAGKSSH